MAPKKAAEISAEISELSELLLEFKELTIERLDSIDASVSSLRNDISEVKKIAEAAEEKAEEALELCRENKLETEKQHDSLRKRIISLENQVEDQINRSMRSTLVINGITGNESNWGETTDRSISAKDRQFKARNRFQTMD